MYGKIIPMSQYQVLNVVTKIAVFCNIYIKLPILLLVQVFCDFITKSSQLKKKQEHIQKSLDLNRKKNHADMDWVVC